MSREVLEALDHRFLNKEVPEFLQQNTHYGESRDRHLATTRAEIAGCAIASRARVRDS